MLGVGKDTSPETSKVKKRAFALKREPSHVLEYEVKTKKGLSNERQMFTTASTDVIQIDSDSDPALNKPITFIEQLLKCRGQAKEGCSIY